MAPLDLTGKIFGKLTVLRRNGKLHFGKLQTAWECQCECGNTIVLPQNRLPHRQSIPKTHIVTACPSCRAHPCVVCSTPIEPPSLNATCSEDCFKAHKRSLWRGQYASYTRFPEFRERQNALRSSRLEKARLDPEYIEKERAREKDRYDKRMQRFNDDPEAREKYNQKVRLAHAKRSERVAVQRKQRLQAMSPEEFADYREYMRRAARAHGQKIRERFRSDPDLHQAYLDQMAEYRRRAALTKFMIEASKLENKNE